MHPLVWGQEGNGPVFDLCLPIREPVPVPQILKTCRYVRRIPLSRITVRVDDLVYLFLRENTVPPKIAAVAHNPHGPRAGTGGAEEAGKMVYVFVLTGS